MFQGHVYLDATLSTLLMICWCVLFTRRRTMVCRRGLRGLPFVWVEKIHTLGHYLNLMMRGFTFPEEELEGMLDCQFQTLNVVWQCGYHLSFGIDSGFIVALARGGFDYCNNRWTKMWEKSIAVPNLLYTHILNLIHAIGGLPEWLLQGELSIGARQASTIDRCSRRLQDRKI